MAKTKKKTKATKRTTKIVKTKAPVKKRLALINLKVTSKDRRALTEMAKKFADGNMSAWLRHAGTHFKPAKNAVIR